MTLAKAPNTCIATQKKNGEVCGRPCTGKLCGLHDPNARLKRGATARSYFHGVRERKKPPLVRTVEAAVDMAAVWLETRSGDDPTEGGWLEKVWRRYVQAETGQLGDLPIEKLDELFPVFVAAVVYEVHQTRPLGSVSGAGLAWKAVRG